MRLKTNNNFVGSKIIRIGPICFKCYGVHKRLPNILPEARLEHDIIGSKLLCSQHVIVARPLVWSKLGCWVVKRWYSGYHPDYHHQPTQNDIYAFAYWLKEHRNQGSLVSSHPQIYLPIMARFSLLGIHDKEHPLIKAVLSKNDLLHGDIVAENILLGNHKPIILDVESVCLGHLAWDAAQIIAYIFRLSQETYAVKEFLDVVGFNYEDKKLTWNLIQLFNTKNRG